PSDSSLSSRAVLHRHRRVRGVEEQFFRAGHGHAGVLLVLGLAFLLLMDRVRPGPRTQWALAIIYLLGVLAQSGGFFLHVLAGAETGSSAGTWLTATGGLLLAVALVGLGVVTLRAGSRGIGQT